GCERCPIGGYPVRSAVRSAAWGGNRRATTQPAPEDLGSRELCVPREPGMVLTQPPAEPATTTVNGGDAAVDDRAVPAPEKPAPGIGPDGVRKLGYVPALDGIRGVAVVAVLLFHGGVSWAKGGFLGVDVFFVLSGFLITTLLLEELAEHQTIHLRQFWTRRVRRLLPALIVVVIATAAVPKLVALDRSAGDLRRDAAAALGYI